MVIAAGGLVMNLGALAILSGSKEHSLNVRGAWLHVASDALGSVGALFSGAAIWLFGWSWADPAASAFIALLVIRSAWSLLGETVTVLMEGTPSHVDVDALRTALVDLSGVRSVHDLHVWTLSQRSVCCSAHVVADDGTDSHEALDSVTSLLRQHGIHHITVQVEDADFARDRCPGCN
jgi:cobalt-zinc-cadmium efflux system protein